MIRRLLIIIAAVLAWNVVAHAAITNLDVKGCAANGDCTISLNASTATLVVCGTASTNGVTVPTPTDANSNTYTAFSTNAFLANPNQVVTGWYSRGGTYANSMTIHSNGVAASTFEAIICFAFGGAGGKDLEAAGSANGSTTTIQPGS